MDNQIIQANALFGQIQTGEPYRCPNCGAAIRKILHYNDYGGHACWKPLDAYGNHLHYLSCYNCNKVTRVAQIGSTVLPFDWPMNVTGEGEARTIQAALTEIIRQVGPQGGSQDPAASIVYRLLAGTLAPEAAISQIRAIVDGAMAGMLVEEPVPLFHGVQEVVE